MIRNLKKLNLMFLSFSAILFFSCETTNLYKWYDYENAAYSYTRLPSEGNQKNLLKQYEKIINGQKNATRQAVPPGIYADYGYFLLQAGKRAEGLEMLEKELELYPESKVLIEKIRNMVQQE